MTTTNQMKHGHFRIQQKSENSGAYRQNQPEFHFPFQPRPEMDPAYLSPLAHRLKAQKVLSLPA